MKAGKLYLKPRKEESLLRFHPWVFSGAVATSAASAADAPLEEGDLVEVCSADGRFLGIGHYQAATIMVRILSFEPVEIGAAFWQESIGRAYELRRTLGLAGREPDGAFRLIHGEGDHLPGLIVDIYAQTAVIQSHSIGMHRARTEIAAALRAVLRDRIHRIYYKSEGTLPARTEPAEAADGYLFGEDAGDAHTAVENGLRFRIDWLKGQKTGFFIDQRENRTLVERYARDRAVLNMFCYTGGFSVYALRGGASLVHSVDSSAKAIALTNENISLNFPHDSRHEAFAEDAFRFMDGIDSRYDLIILDPPAFAKHRDALRNGLQGYRKLNAIAFKKIKPGGIIFTFSCSQIVGRTDFRLAVFSAAALSGRRVRILHQLTQPADHPVNIYHPEGEYLKGLVLQVE